MPPAFQVLSDKLSADLDLEALFCFLDRTNSCIGQQYLYHRLRVIDEDQQKLLKLDRAAQLFTEDESSRIAAQGCLKELNQPEAYFMEELFHKKASLRPYWYPLVYLLSLSSLILLVLSYFYPVLLLGVAAVFAANLLIHFWNKYTIGYHSAPLIEYSKAYKAATKLEKIGLVQAFYESPSCLASLKGLNNKMRLLNLNPRIENDITSIGYYLIELIKILFNLEVILFFSLIGQVNSRRDQLHALFIYLGEIDLALSTASFRAGLAQWCRPNFGAPGQLKLHQLNHPLVANCIPNTLELHHKSLLLTGSNMSGKTTFIRSIGLNMLLAQTLYTCTAQQYQAPFSKIYSSIRITDDLLQQRSYYLEEVITLKEFIDQAKQTSPSLFILDEIFKGTNTVERIAGGKAILSHLAAKNHMVLVPHMTLN